MVAILLRRLSRLRCWERVGCASAQTPEPDFELIVEARAGPTSITWVRGCRNVGGERHSSDGVRSSRSILIVGQQRRALFILEGAAGIAP